MKKTPGICLLVIALALVAGPALAQDWAGKGRAQGIIKNEAGDPVEGAKVTLRPVATPDSGPEPVYTNDKGRWSLLGLAGGSWQVLIDADGYLPSEGSVRVNPFQATAPIVVTLTANPYSSIDEGDALLDKEMFAEARAAYQEAMAKLEPGPAARLRSRIGDTYLAEGNYAAARAEYESALAYIAPEEQAHIRLQLAQSYQAEKNFAKAREEFEKLLPLLTPEGQAEIYKNMARGLDQEGKREEAIATLEKAVAVAPENVEILQLTADLLTRVGREDEASKYLEMMPEGTELPTDMVLNIGIRLYNEGNMAKALEYFNRAVEENADLAETYYYRGLVYLSQEANDRALADFKKLIELEPDSPRRAEVEEFMSYIAPQE